MEVPVPPWHRPPRRRAAKPQLSQELIVTTALEILAKEGIAAVSMRRVARALETGAASLYAYVSNKDELDELMLDYVLGTIPLPEPDPRQWQRQCVDLLHAQVRAMVAHPGIANVAWRIMIPVGPNALRHGEALIALLRAGGLSLKHAAFGADTLSTYAKAFAVEGNAFASGDVSAEQIEQRSRQMREYLNSLPPKTFPNLLEANRLFTADTAAERLIFALNAFLAGLERAG